MSESRTSAVGTFGKAQAPAQKNVGLKFNWLMRMVTP